MKKIINAVFLLILFFIVGACEDAPRTNPIDSGEVVLKGYVASNYSLNGLGNIVVYTEPASDTVSTDSTGAFIFKDLPEDSYTFHVMDSLQYEDDVHIIDYEEITQEIIGSDTIYIDTIFISRAISWSFEDVSVGNLPSGWVRLNGEWSVENEPDGFSGERSLVGLNRPEDSLATITVPTDNHRNYTLRVNFKYHIEEDTLRPGYSSIGFLLRSSLVTQYTLAIRPTGTYLYRTRFISDYDQIHSSTNAIEPGRWHSLQVQLFGNYISYAVNNNWERNIYDDAIDRGGNAVTIVGNGRIIIDDYLFVF
jgi:hypothetical protein